MVNCSIDTARAPQQGSSKLSAPPAMGCSADDDQWVTDAQQLVQEITATVQASNGDVTPVHDAARYEKLCADSQQVCMQALASLSASDPATFSPVSLQLLYSISTGVMQLASAVFCDADVALQLLAAGSYTAATDKLKGTVKELAAHIISCMDAQQSPASNGHLPGSENMQNISDATSHTAAVQRLMPAAQAVAQQLLHIALSVAAFVTGAPAALQVGDGSAAIPKDMRSMAVLNLAWANLTRLLLAVPAEAKQQVLQPAEILQGLRCALQQLQRAVHDLAQQPEGRREVVVKFWLQSVSRLTSVLWDQAAADALKPLLDATLSVYEYACSQGCVELPEVQAFVQPTLQPRLVACITALLACSSGDREGTSSNLDSLIHCRSTSTSSSSHHSRPQMQHDMPAEQGDNLQQLRLQAHLLMVLDVMQQLPNMSLEVLQQGCKRLLPWAVETAGCQLCSFVLADDSGGALLQHVLQCCLVSVVGCISAAPQELQGMFHDIAALALARHPLVAFIAQQLLADVLACCSPNLQQQLLSGLHGLLEAAALCAAAVPEGDEALSHAAETLATTVATSLQACGDEVVISWVSQSVCRTIGSSSNHSSLSSHNSSSSWLDAGRCSLLTCHCKLLTHLAHMQLPLMQHTVLEECLNHLWLTGQQALELLVHSNSHLARQQAAPSAGADSACESLILHHQLCWLLQATAAVLELQQSLATSNPTEQASKPELSALRQSCGAFALDVLRCLHSNSTCVAAAAAATAQSAAASHAACISSALTVLAAAGQVPVNEGAAEVLSMLQWVAQEHRGLHGLLAAVCGNLGVPPGSVGHEKLFQLLLSSQHWAVQHAALDGVLQRLRHGNYTGTGIVKLLPASMRSSSTEATPGVIAVMKAHLHKQPDQQAQQAFEEQYGSLAGQHSHALAALYYNSGGSTGCIDDSSSISSSSSSSSSHLSKLLVSKLPMSLQQLEHLLATCSLQPSSIGAGGAEAGPADVSEGAGQVLLQLAASAAGSLDALDKSLSQAEGDIQVLLSAAAAAVQKQQVNASEVVLVSRQAASLVGTCASLCSRLRCLQDNLACLKQ